MTNENTSPYDICFGVLYMRKHKGIKYPCHECGMTEDCRELSNSQEVNQKEMENKTK
jgi:hypothetical protein